MSVVDASFRDCGVRCTAVAQGVSRSVELLPNHLNAQVAVTGGFLQVNDCLELVSVF